MKVKHVFNWLTALLLIITLYGALPAAAAPDDGSLQAARGPKPKFYDNVAFDVSPTLVELAARRITPEFSEPDASIRKEHGPIADGDTGFTGDEEVQTSLPSSSIPSTAANFEGVSNQDNFNVFGFRVNPPDPVG